jgi:uncharacterized protein
MRMNTEPKTYIVFAGTNLIARGQLAEVVQHGKALFDRDDVARIALYDDATGHPVDIDFTGTEAEVVAKLTTHPVVGPARPGQAEKKKPGRPRLGVVSREISLLPRHWRWLAAQRGGASAALRRLVDTARKNGAGEDQVRRAIDAAHRFMWDIAGDLPDFEEASRSLFDRDFDTFAIFIASWPPGIQEQLNRYISRANGKGDSS